MNSKNSTFKVVFMCVALILVLVILYSGLQIMESTVFYEQPEETVATKAIVKDSVRYYPRQDIMVILLMGIEHKGIVEAHEMNYGYPADMITLMIFDKQTGECDLLCLNRDTMTKMPALNEFGRQEGYFYTQLALSHTFGTGLEDSCENTRTTVSDLLGGINIDYYYAMNMDAIALLNDAVGGVTVTIEDDFSLVDPALQKGEMTLMGEQAVTFVRSRKNVGDQLNLSRMKRQREYMEGFVDALRAKIGENITEVVQIYDQVAPYAVTDCSGTVMNRLMEDYGDYSLGQVYTLPGENVRGEKHYEFYVDEEALDELILQLFYAPVE